MNGHAVPLPLSPMLEVVHPSLLAGEPSFLCAGMIRGACRLGISVVGAADPVEFSCPADQSPASDTRAALNFGIAEVSLP